VFLTDVRISDRLRLGEVNGGWKVAITTLSNERLALTGDAAVGRNLIAPLLRLASRVPAADGRRLIDDSGFRERLASYYVTVAGIDHIGARISTALSRGQNPGSEAAIGKMTLTRWLQAMGTFGMDLAGVAGAIVDRDADPDLFEIQQGFFLAPGYRMGGGTEEIGKNILAERVLGLPPDIRVERTSPSRGWRIDAVRLPRAGRIPVQAEQQTARDRTRVVARTRLVDDPVSRLQHRAVVVDRLALEYQKLLATGVHVRDTRGARLHAHQVRAALAARVVR
jgi:hypothetical protein